MNVLRIALNDLRRMFKDRMLPVWWGLMPLGFIYLFAAVLNSPQTRTVWVPVINHDEHELSSLLIDELRTDGYYVDVRAATDEINVQYWPCSIVIPATFSADVLAGTPAHVQFVRGKGGQESSLSAQTRLVRTLVKYNGALAAADVVTNRWTDRTKERFAEELKKPMQMRVENQEHPSLRPPPVGFALTLPGYLVMFMMMNCVMYGGVTLVVERSNKQLARIIAAPVSSLEVFLGKILGRTIQPLLQAALLLVVGYWMFGVPLGDHPAAMAPVLLCFALLCGSISVLIGSLCGDEKQVTSIGILVTMLFSALGGCWWPIEIASTGLRTAAMFTPTFWALQAVHDVMSFGKSFSGVMEECAYLTLYIILVLAITIPLFERRKQSG
ncbi:MAG: ABC transporter permease subunit [bacterium]|nr:ABC transporter permease subunit [bacterium]